MMKNKLIKAFTMLTASAMMLGSFSQTAFAENDSPKAVMNLIRHNCPLNISADVIYPYDTNEEMMSDIGIPQKYAESIDGGCVSDSSRVYIQLGKNGLTDKEFAEFFERLYAGMNNNPRLSNVTVDLPVGMMGADLDKNGDGIVDISDAASVIKYYSENAAGMENTEEYTKNDINGDGTVDISDAAYILKYYAEVGVGLR